jgi:hypothetical protein
VQFTFPLGVFTVATTTIGKEMPSPFFNVLGTVSALAYSDYCEMRTDETNTDLQRYRHHPLALRVYNDSKGCGCWQAAHCPMFEGSINQQNLE